MARNKQLIQSVRSTHVEKQHKLVLKCCAMKRSYRKLQDVLCGLMIYIRGQQKKKQKFMSKPKRFKMYTASKKLDSWTKYLK